jgi:hypothetical protein
MKAGEVVPIRGYPLFLANANPSERHPYYHLYLPLIPWHRLSEASPLLSERIKVRIKLVFG